LTIIKLARVTRLFYILMVTEFVEVGGDHCEARVGWVKVEWDTITVPPYIACKWSVWAVYCVDRTMTSLPWLTSTIGIV